MSNWLIENHTKDELRLMEKFYKNRKENTISSLFHFIEIDSDVHDEKNKKIYYTRHLVFIKDKDDNYIKIINYYFNYLLDLTNGLIFRKMKSNTDYRILPYQICVGNIFKNKRRNLKLSR